MSKKKYMPMRAHEIKKVWHRADYAETRSLFERLKQRALAKEPLTVAEQNYFCQCIEFSKLPDGRLEDYAVCSDYLFNYLYAIYGNDLTGGSIYRRPKGVELEIVPLADRVRDLNSLQKFSSDWHIIITKTNHNDALLQEVATETRYWIKELDKNPGFSSFGFFRKCNRYEFFLQKILLFSKWLALVCREIFEEAEPHDFVLQLNGYDIELTEYTFVHILFRHFAQALKPFDFDKSFHSPDIRPRILHKQLRIIFDSIDQSGLVVFTGSNLANEPLRFKYRGVPYLLYVNKRKKQIKGVKGNVDYLRLETFFQITSEDELTKLMNEYTEVVINSVVSVFRRK